ncbi:amino acid transporter heavy chain SLC3A1-like [Mytilus edulis]|uniref:amino acid transporter heavy chain SLC3A1-like n=1 Tax=Mytilus edulis TaxID=6550 RepID=UPI0039F00B27
MADESTVDEKAQLKAELAEPAVDDDPKFNGNVENAKFLTNGGDVKVEVETSSSGGASFTGLGKEELLQYANDPFWKKVRVILFILFWVGWIAMLAAAIVIIVLAPRCPHRPDLKWYDKQASYQVYPKSFKDTNKPGKAEPGEGVGDLQGIISELEDGHFQDLGVETLYINSFYKSGGVDNGMDVVDYKDVEPSLGTLAHIRKLRKETKDKMRLVVDFIPNHTSRNHTWFVSSQNKQDPYTDYYVWKPCTKGGAMPNNWLSVYGGSAWEYDDLRGECYLHTFLKEQPDLDLMNEDVRKEMKDVLSFWLKEGIDGFHVRNAEYLVENMTLGNEIASGSGSVMTYESLIHDHTTHQPESFELLQEWRAVLDTAANKPGREKALIVTVDTDMNTTMKYYETNGKSGATYVRMSPITNYNTNGLATHLKDRIQEVAVDDVHRKIWMLDNENLDRIASLIGDEYMKALLAVQILLPGVSSSYYGDEIAMKNGVPATPSKDPVSKLPNQKNRDAFRTPMQWSSEQPNAGFTDPSFMPWIPLGTNYKTNNVQHAKAYHSKHSIMNTFKQLVLLASNESIQFGKTVVSVLKDNNDILWMTRKAEGFSGYLVIINLGDSPFASNFKEAKISNTLMHVFHSDGDLIEGDMDLSKRAVSIAPKHVHVYKFD